MFFALNFRFRQRETTASLSKRDKSLLIYNYLWGALLSLLESELKCLLLSMAHLRIHIPSHTDEVLLLLLTHIIPTISVSSSVDISGTGIPWMESANSLKVSVLFFRSSLCNFGRMTKCSSWLLYSTQLRNGNVTWWLKNAIHRSSVMNISLAR